MLGGWLDEAWPEADPRERESFERLLEVEDDRLWDWFLGRTPPDKGLEDIVESIRARHFTSSGR